MHCLQTDKSFPEWIVLIFNLCFCVWIKKSDTISTNWILCGVFVSNNSNKCQFSGNLKWNKHFTFLVWLWNRIFVYFKILDCWGEWSPWTNCTYGECGFQMGTKFRNRTCMCNEMTAFGTPSCPTESNQTVPCNPDWGSDDCPLGKIMKISSFPSSSGNDSVMGNLKLKMMTCHNKPSTLLYIFLQ